MKSSFVPLLGLIVFLASGQTALGAVIKVSTAYPEGFIVKTLRATGKEIATQTEGRVKLKIYPGGVQGDNKTVLKKIKRGILSGALIESGPLAADYKDSQIYNAPMAFKTFAEVDYVREQMDGQLIAGFEKSGWKMFGLVEGGFVYAMTNQPVVDFETLQSQKLWLPANDPLSKRVAGSFGLSPIFLGVGEVLTALQTGAVNAIVAPPTAALTLQWYTKVTHVTDVPFLYTYATLALSDKVFNKLSADDQRIVSELFAKALKEMDKNNRRDNLQAFEALTGQGLKVVKPDLEAAARLRKRAMQATEQLVEAGEFSADMLQRLNGLLQEYRNGQPADAQGG